MRQAMFVGPQRAGSHSASQIEIWFLWIWFGAEVMGHFHRTRCQRLRKAPHLVVAGTDIAEGLAQDPIMG